MPAHGSTTPTWIVALVIVILGGALMLKSNELRRAKLDIEYARHELRESQKNFDSLWFNKGCQGVVK